MTAGFLRGLFIVAFVAIASSFPGVGQADGAKPLRVTGFIQQGGPYRSTLVREEGGPDVARLEAVFTRAQALLAPLRLPITLSTDATVIVSHDYDLYLTNIRRAFLARGVDPTELDRLHGVDRLVRSLFFRTKAESDPRMHDNPATARLYAPHIGIHFVGDINALAGTQHLVNERAIGWYIPMAWWTSEVGDDTFPVIDADAQGMPFNTGRYLIIVADRGSSRQVGAVLAHEIGHALGLPHVEDDPNNLMYPTVMEGAKQWLTQEQVTKARSGLAQFGRTGMGASAAGGYPDACAVERGEWR